MWWACTSLRPGGGRNGSGSAVVVEGAFDAATGTSQIAATTAYKANPTPGATNDVAMPAT